MKMTMCNFPIVCHIGKYLIFYDIIHIYPLHVVLVESLSEYYQMTSICVSFSYFAFCVFGVLMGELDQKVQKPLLIRTEFGEAPDFCMLLLYNLNVCLKYLFHSLIC